jgi:hypothetical protein
VCGSGGGWANRRAHTKWVVPAGGVSWLRGQFGVVCMALTCVEHHICQHKHNRVAGMT